MAKKKEKKSEPVESTPQEYPSGTKEISPSDWMKRIKSSLRYRDKIKREQQWDRLIKEYEGKYEINLTRGGSNVPPINLVFGYVDTASARIYYRNPHMSINPKGQESINAARILELDVNYSFKHLGLKKTVDQCLIDSLGAPGHGWVKLGYVNSTGEMVTDPGTEPQEYIKDEEIFIVYVPWEDVIFDTSMSKNPPYDCKWIAHRIVKTVQEMKADKNYENTGKIESNVATRDTKDGEERNKAEIHSDTDLDLFEFWEITDLETKKVYAVSDNCPNYHKNKDYKYEMRGLPFCMLAFNRSNGKPYPFSDVYLGEPQWLERIKLRAAQLNHMKRWGRQLSIEQGAMTNQEVEKFQQGTDGALIQRLRGSAPPVPIEYAPLQGEIFAIDNLLQSDLDATLGQSDLDRGAPPKTNAKTTKYQLQEQNQGTSVRQNKKQDRLEDFIEEITDKYISLVKQFQDIPKYVRITGMKPDEIKQAFGQIQGVTVDETGIKYTKEAIKGEYEVEAKAGSTLPLNRENKIKLIETTLQLGPAIGIVPGSPASIALGKALFRELDMQDVQAAYDQQAEMMKNAPPQPPQQPRQSNVQHHVHHSGPPARPGPQGPGAGPIPPPGGK